MEPVLAKTIGPTRADCGKNFQLRCAPLSPRTIPKGDAALHARVKDRMTPEEMDALNGLISSALAEKQK